MINYADDGESAAVEDHEAADDDEADDTAEAALPRYGPFSGYASPTQTVEDTQKILESGELWGGPGRMSDTPMVLAHNGPLPANKECLEFYTDVAPNPNDVPHRANWSSGRPGIEPRRGGEMAGIPIVITRVNHGGIKLP